MRFIFSMITSVVLFLLGLGISAQRGMFLLTAERTSGTVSAIHGHNGRCGSKNNHYDCTEYQADVKYTSTKQEEAVIQVSAGSTRGHDQPMSHASLAVGAAVPVIYSKKDIKYAFRDSFFDLWALPIGSLFGSGVFFLGAFARRR